MHERSKEIAEIIGHPTSHKICSVCRGPMTDDRVVGEQIRCIKNGGPGTPAVIEAGYTGFDFFNDDAAVADFVKPWLRQQSEAFMYQLYLQLIGLYSPLNPMRLLTLPPHILCQALINTVAAIKDKGDKIKLLRERKRSNAEGLGG